MIPFASKMLGRPVKWIEDRREHLVSCNHSRDQTCRLEIAAKRDGTITAMRAAVYGNNGGYVRTHGGVVPLLTATLIPGPLPRAQLRGAHTVCRHQQDGRRHPARSGHVRGGLLSREAHRHDGPRPWHRPCGNTVQELGVGLRRCPTTPESSGLRRTHPPSTTVATSPKPSKWPWMPSIMTTSRSRQGKLIDGNTTASGSALSWSSPLVAHPTKPPRWS